MKEIILTNTGKLWGSAGRSVGGHVASSALAAILVSAILVSVFSGPLMAAPTVLSPDNFTSCIFDICHRFEMPRKDARFSGTRMVQIQTLRNRPDKYRVRCPMRELEFAIQKETSISILVGCPDPKPAILAFLFPNVLHESCFDSGLWASIGRAPFFEASIVWLAKTKGEMFPGTARISTREMSSCWHDFLRRSIRESASATARKAAFGSRTLAEAEVL